MTALQELRKDQECGWVVPSESKPCHLTTVAKAFEEARKGTKLPREIKLYSARHGFATKRMGATGGLALVMRALGRTNAQTAMIYQHPSLERVRAVVSENPVPDGPTPGPFLVRRNPVTCTENGALPKAVNC